MLIFGDFFTLLRLKTQTSINLGPNVYPACLPKKDFCFRSGSEAWVSEYGVESFGGQAASDLQHVMVPIMEHESNCRQVYNAGINEVVCAGFPEGGQDACQGDSGGPLVLMYKKVRKD